MNEIDWKHEGERFEREIYGLVRALMTRRMRRYNRPWLAWSEMVEDACILAWQAWHSMRSRGREPQEVGIWAIADRCVRSVLGGKRFHPVGKSYRWWAYSIHKPKNRLEAHDLAEWRTPTGQEEGPEMIDLDEEYRAWLDTLTERDRRAIDLFQSGASRAVAAERLGIPIKTLRVMWKRLAGSFERWLNR